MSICFSILRNCTTAPHVQFIFMVVVVINLTIFSKSSIERESSTVNGKEHSPIIRSMRMSSYDDILQIKQNTTFKSEF